MRIDHLARLSEREAIYALKTRSGDHFALATDDGQCVSAAATSDAAALTAAWACSYPASSSGVEMFI